MSKNNSVNKIIKKFNNVVNNKDNYITKKKKRKKEISKKINRHF